MIPTKKQGDALRAAEVNEITTSIAALQAAARPGAGSTGKPGSFTEPSVACDALNDDSVDLKSYQPVEISGHVYTGSNAEFQRCLKMITPTEDARGRFAILSRATPKDYVGKVHLAGVCLARVRTASGDKYCDIVDGADYLLGDPDEGGAEILSDFDGPDSATHLALIRFPRGGGGDSRWTVNSAWTATPASATRITMSATTGIFAGLPIRYTTSAGGSTYFYALIDTVASTYIDIKGPTLTSQTITGLWIGTPDCLQVLSLFVNGLYAVTNQNILTAVGKTYFEWPISPAALVTFKAWNNTNGAGTAVVNVKIGSNAVAVSGITPTSSGVAAGVVDATKYSVVRGSVIDIAVTTTDATARNLTVLFTFVLA